MYNIKLILYVESLFIFISTEVPEVHISIDGRVFEYILGEKSIEIHFYDTIMLLFCFVV